MEKKKLPALFLPKPPPQEAEVTAPPPSEPVGQEAADIAAKGTDGSSKPLKEILLQLVGGVEKLSSDISEVTNTLNQTSSSTIREVNDLFTRVEEGLLTRQLEELTKLNETSSTQSKDLERGFTRLSNVLNGQASDNERGFNQLSADIRKLTDIQKEQLDQAALEKSRAAAAAEETSLEGGLRPEKTPRQKLKAEDTKPEKKPGLLSSLGERMRGGGIGLRAVKMAAVASLASRAGGRLGGMIGGETGEKVGEIAGGALGALGASGLFRRRVAAPTVEAPNVKTPDVKTPTTAPVQQTVATKTPTPTPQVPTPTATTQPSASPVSKPSVTSQPVMTPEQKIKYDELRKQGVPAVEAKAQATQPKGFSAYAQKEKAIMEAAGKPPAPPPNVPAKPPVPTVVPEPTKVPTSVPEPTKVPTAPSEPPKVPAAAGKEAAEAAGKKGILKTAAGVGGKALRFIPGVGLALAAGEAVYSSASSAMDAEKVLGLKEGQKATTGERVAAGAGGLTESLSFGLISKESAGRFYKGLTGAGTPSSQAAKELGEGKASINQVSGGQVSRSTAQPAPTITAADRQAASATGAGSSIPAVPPATIKTAPTTTSPVGNLPTPAVSAPAVSAPAVPTSGASRVTSPPPAASSPSASAAPGGSPPTAAGMGATGTAKPGPIKTGSSLGKDDKEIVKIVEAGPGFNVVEKEDGTIEKRSGPRNWRNNNPGNINFSSFAQGKGALGADPRFAIFPSYSEGREAKAALLFEGKNYKDLKVSDAIARYAPPSENDTAMYQRVVLDAIGGTDIPLKDLKPQQREAMLNTMEKLEGFKTGKVEVLQQGKQGSAAPVSVPSASPPAAGKSQLETQVATTSSGTGGGKSSEDSSQSTPSTTSAAPSAKPAESSFFGKVASTVSGIFGGGKQESAQATPASMPTISAPAPAPVSVQGQGEAATVVKTEDIAKVVRPKDSSVNLQGLNPAFKQRFAAMAAEYEQMTGKKMQVNSGFRDPKEQAELFAKYGSPRAAPPGRSRHESGVAIDINSSDANKAIELGLFAKYGFTRPVPGETWHVEPVETAKQGGVPDNPFAPGQAIAVAGKGGKPVLPSVGMPVAIPESKPAVSSGGAEAVSTAATTLPKDQGKPSATGTSAAPAGAPAATQVASATPAQSSTAAPIAQTASAATPQSGATPIPNVQAPQLAQGPAPQQQQSAGKSPEPVAMPRQTNVAALSEKVGAASAAPIVVNNVSNNNTSNKGSAPAAPRGIPAPYGDRGSLAVGTTFVAAA